MTTSASERRRARFVLLILAAIMLFPTIASAEPTAAERETARTLLLSGREKRKAGQLKEALTDFERAHAIMRVPTTALDLGKMQETLGMLVEARATFLEATRYPSRADESHAFKRARRDAKQLADEISPRLATLTILVSNGAQVKIDGADISSSSLSGPLKVNPGKHEIVATLGREEKRSTIELAEASTQSVDLTIAGAPSAAAPSSTTSTTTTNPPPATAATTATTTTTTTTKKTNPLVWIGLGAAGIGTVAGGITGALAISVHADVASRCQAGVRCPPSTYSDIDRGTTFGTIATIAFIVAGVGAAVFVYGLLTPTTVPAATTTGSAAKIDWLRGTF